MKINRNLTNMEAGVQKGELSYTSHSMSLQIPTQRGSLPLQKEVTPLNYCQQEEERFPPPPPRRLATAQPMKAYHHSTYKNSLHFELPVSSNEILLTTGPPNFPFLLCKRVSSLLLCWSSMFYHSHMSRTALLCCSQINTFCC